MVEGLDAMIDWMEWNDATLAIKLHIGFAIMGIVTGVIAMVARKGSLFHRRMGRAFAYSAALTTLVSFLIHEIRLWGIWSPIHLLSLYVLFSIWYGVTAVRKGRLAQHATTMRIVFTSGFVVATGFTLLPDRLLGQAFLVPMLQSHPAIDFTLATSIASAMPFVGIAVAIWIYRKTILGGLRRFRRSQNA